MDEQTVNGRARPQRMGTAFPFWQAGAGSGPALAGDCQNSDTCRDRLLVFQSECSLLCMDRLFSCMFEYCSWPLASSLVSFPSGSLHCWMV